MFFDVHGGVTSFKDELILRRSFIFCILGCNVFIFIFLKSIATPQDAHKLVLEVAEWFTASLSGLARHELTT